VPPPRTDFPGFGAQNEGWATGAKPKKEDEFKPLDPALVMGGRSFPGFGAQGEAYGQSLEANYHTQAEVRNHVMDQARKRYGARLSDSHYELMGDYAVAARLGKSASSMKQIYDLAAKGQFDVMRKAVANSDPLAEFKRQDAITRPKFEESRRAPLGSGVMLPIDPWAKLPFTRTDYEEALNRGLPAVRLKGSQRTIKIDDAQRQVAKVVGVEPSRQMTKTPAQVEAEDIAAAGGGPKQPFGAGNPNAKKGLSEHLIDRVFKDQGLTEDSNPYSAAALRFLAGIIDVPAQVSQVYTDALDPETRNLHKFGADTLRSLDALGIEGIFNPKAPKIDGPERFMRFLNLGLTAAGGVVGVRKLREFVHSNTGLGFAREMGVTRKEAFTILDDIEARVKEESKVQKPDADPVAGEAATPPVEKPPVPIADLPPGKGVKTGVKSRAMTPDAKRVVDVENELVELSDLIVSHDLTGKENPLFPQGWQNRDRGKKASLDQVQSRASQLSPIALLEDFKATDRGAPIVDSRNIVVSGNGRAMSILAALERVPDRYENYRKALIEQHPDAANMTAPVLVRRLVGEFDDQTIQDIAKESNTSSVARMTPFEDASNDAVAIPKDFATRFVMRGKTLADALASPDNKDLVDAIVAQIPENERSAMFDGNGEISEPGRGRIARAMLYRIFGDDAKPVLEKAFEEGDFSKRIMGGMEQAAGDLADLAEPKNAVGAEMRGKISQAMILADQALSQSKVPAREWFNQGSILARDPGAMKIARALVTAKSKDQVAFLMGKLARAADDSDGGMFGDDLAFKNADEAITAALPDEIGAVDGDTGTVDVGTQAASETAPARSAWQYIAPDALVHNERGRGRAANHPDLKAAKAGDVDAAARMVDDLWNDDVLSKTRAEIGDRKPTIVPVAAETSVGTNALPVAFAHKLARELGLPLGTDILKVNRTDRTGSSAIYRLVTRSEFDGPVKLGQEYVIVDDFLTQGGTLADLKGYIEGKGGKVILATALQSSPDSAGFAPKPEQLAALRKAHPDIDAIWQKEAGHGINGLTRSEAEFLLRKPELVDAIREGGFVGAREKYGATSRPQGGKPGQSVGGLFDEFPEDDFELKPQTVKAPKVKKEEPKPEFQHPVGEQLSFDETGDATGQRKLLERKADYEKPADEKATKNKLKDMERRIGQLESNVDFWKTKRDGLEDGTREFDIANRKFLEFSEKLRELDNEYFRASGQPGSQYMKTLPETGLPDKPKSAYTPEEFQRRIDEITKIAKAGGANVFNDLRKRGVLGIFANPTAKFRRGRIRLNDRMSASQMADTLAHEVGHQIDSIISQGQRKFDNKNPQETTGNFEILFDVKGELASDAIFDELVKVTEALVGKDVVEQDPAYFMNNKELFARFMQSVMFHPNLVDAYAPKAFAKLAKQAEKFPQLADYIEIGKGAMLEHDVPIMFLPDKRQQRISRYGNYLGTKIYGEEVLYNARRAKALKETSDLLKEKFRGVKDKPEVLFDAAEGILATKNGNPEFGTKIYKSVDVPFEFTPDDVRFAMDGGMTTDAKLQKMFDELAVLGADGYQFVGFDKYGAAQFEKWRKTPAEAELAFNSLSDRGKEMIREYTADISEAKDLFNRERMKEYFQIDAEIEGYVHHFFEDGGLTEWRRKFLKERKAAATQRRGEKEGFVKDFKKATAKALSELHIVREWNDFVVRQLAMVAEPLPAGETRPTKVGWVPIEGDLLHGLSKLGDDRTVLLKEDGTSFLLKRGKRYQVPVEIYETYIKHGAFGEEISQAARVVNSLNRYWQSNILTHTGTASTNIISGAIQTSAYVLDNFYRDILYGDLAMPRTRATVMGLMETLTPKGWKGAPDWAYGGDESQFYHQFYGTKGQFSLVDASLDKLLTPYKNIERFFKKAIVNAEARKSGFEDPFNDPEFIMSLNQVVDLFAYDYSNIPFWLEQLKRHPAGAGVKPFLTYPYKYAKMLSSMIGGTFDKNLPMKDRVAKTMALGTILMAYGIYKKSKDDPNAIGTVKGYDSETDSDLKLKSVVNPRGRLYMGQDESGKDVFLRTAKYPFLNAFDTLEALFAADWDEVGQIMNDQLGTIGPLGKFTLNQFGYSGEFDKFKTKETMHAETAASFIPLGRMLKDTAEYLDPKKRDLPTTPGLVFGQYLPTSDPDLAELLHGPEATAKVPLKPDELELIKKRSYGAVVALVTERLGEEAGKELQELIDGKLRKQMGIGNSTIELRVPKQDRDVLSKMLGGIIFKRIDREWYERFKQRAIENKAEREAKKAAKEAEEKEAKAKELLKSS
jgi:hypothetical protein